MGVVYALCVRCVFAYVRMCGQMCICGCLVCVVGLCNVSVAVSMWVCSHVQCVATCVYMCHTRTLRGSQAVAGCGRVGVGAGACVGAAREHQHVPHPRRRASLWSPLRCVACVYAYVCMYENLCLSACLSVYLTVCISVSVSSDMRCVRMGACDVFVCVC